MTTENKLWRAVQARSADKIEKIFQDIYCSYSGLVGCVISKYVWNRHDVADLVDDVFLALSREMLCKPLENIKYFLVACAKNAAVNFCKRASRDVVYLDDLPPSEAAATCADLPFWELVSSLKSVLSEREAEIVLLHAVFGYTFRELGQKYRCPAGTMYTTYSRAISKYKKEHKK